MRFFVTVLFGEAHRSDEARLAFFERDLRELPPLASAVGFAVAAGAQNVVEADFLRGEPAQKLDARKLAVTDDAHVVARRQKRLHATQKGDLLVGAVAFAPSVNAPGERKSALTVSEAHGQHPMGRPDFGRVQDQANRLPRLLKRREQLPRERTVQSAGPGALVFEKTPQPVGQAHQPPGQRPRAHDLRQVRAPRQKQTAGQKRQVAQSGNAFVGEKPLHGSEHFSREAKAVLHSESGERFELGRYEPAIPTLAGQPSLLLRA
jgi:hypothetical protein